MYKKLLLPLVVASLSTTATAAEFKVGEPVERDGMKLQILYIQAVEMSQEPAAMSNMYETMEKGHDHASHGDAGHGDQDHAGGHGNESQHAGHGGGHGNHGGPADIHLEASIHALANNAWGFKEGSWIPYLNVTYEVAKYGSHFKKRGRLVPMASNDGPHYGANLQLDGAGKYFVTYKVKPPLGSEFPYHVDAETGVSGWWQPFEMKDSFTYIGTGKKGGY